MPREFDPNNLTAGDVIRLVVPLVAFIAILVIVGRFAPDYVLLIPIALVLYFAYWIFTLPKSDIEAIAKADQKLNQKIRNVPFVGPVAVSLLRVFEWVISIVSAIFLIFVVFVAIRNICRGLFAGLERQAAADNQPRPASVIIPIAGP